jgi:predicted TIM-barrel fold metal-dependent hydrolase
MPENRTATLSPTTGRIDVHCHYFPPVFMAALDEAGITAAGSVVIPPWSPELALSFMDRLGIATQVVSVSDPGVGFVPAEKAVALARAVNQYGKDLITAYPDRFGVLAVLPLPDVEASVAEVEYALDILGLDGVGILSSYGGIYPGDERLDPVLAALDARGAYVMIHPTAVSADNRPAMPGVPEAAMEFTFDTTRAAAKLIWSGAMERFPNIRWSLSHAGGTLPFLTYRVSMFSDVIEAPHGNGTPPGQGTAAQSTRAAIARFYYDTALSHTPTGMSALRGATPVSNVLFGSDYPFAEPLYPKQGDPQPELGESFDDDELRAVGRLNALALFPRLARVLQS